MTHHDSHVTDATPEQVRAWLKAGRANLETKARAAGSEDWLTLGDFAEFNPQALPPVMAPATDFEPAPVRDTHEAAGRGAQFGREQRGRRADDGHPRGHQGIALGTQAVRVNRFGLADDRIPGKPAALIADLGSLAALI